MRSNESYSYPNEQELTEHRLEQKTQVGVLALVASAYVDPVGVAASVTRKAIDPILLDNENDLHLSA